MASPEIVENKRFADSENASCDPTSVLQQGLNLAASKQRNGVRQSAKSTTERIH
jgi:hypothetical protein